MILTDHHNVPHNLYYVCLNYTYHCDCGCCGDFSDVARAIVAAVTEEEAVERVKKDVADEVELIGVIVYECRELDLQLVNRLPIEDR